MFFFCCLCLPGKGDRNAVLDSDVVLTKMKLLNNFNEKFRSTENSTLSAAPVSEHDTPDPGEASEVNSHPEDKSGMDSGAGYLPGIFSDSHLSRLYKFESEDSGVELPSGANSPSTPTGSEKSFAVHSRESSCHCCNLDSDSTSSPDALATEDQNSKEANGLKDSTNSTVDTQDDVFTDRDNFDPSVVTAKLYICEEMDQRDATGFTSEDVRERSDRRNEKISSNDKNSSESVKPADEFLPAQCKDETDVDIKAESLRRSDTRDSLEDYMDICCKLSEVRKPLFDYPSIYPGHGNSSYSKADLMWTNRLFDNSPTLLTQRSQSHHVMFFCGMLTLWLSLDGSVGEHLAAVEVAQSRSTV